MEELTEVITAAEFHPIHCNMFMYSSSKGAIKLSDMRASALCDQYAKGIIFCNFLHENTTNARDTLHFKSTRKPRIQQVGHSFQKSSRPSQTSNSVKMAGISYPETT